MRKITCLLIALLCSFASVVSAQSITSLDELSNSKAFTIRCGRGYLYANSGHTELVATKAGEDNPELTNDFKFVLYKHTDSKFYLYNLGAGKFVQQSGEGTSLTTSPSHELAILANEKGAYKEECPWFLAVNGKLLNNNGNRNARTNWGTTALEDDKVDQGNQWAIEEAGTIEEGTIEGFLAADPLFSLTNKAQQQVNCNAGFSGNDALQEAITENTYVNGDKVADVESKLAALQTAYNTHFAAAPVKYLNADNGLPGTESEKQYTWKSDLLTFSQNVDRIRFTVKQTNTGNHHNNSTHPFFALSEMRMYDANGKQITLDGSKITSNAKESSEGTFAALVDGNTTYNTNFFHSTWKAAGPDADHYVEFILPAEVTSVQLEFVSRNENNVPSEVFVQGLEPVQSFTAGIYRIVSANTGFTTTKAMTGRYGSNERPGWEDMDANDPEQYWEVSGNDDEGYTIRNCDFGINQYIVVNNGQGQGSTFGAEGTKFSIIHLGAGQYNIQSKTSEYPLHCANQADGWASSGLTTWAGSLNSASAWTFVASDAVTAGRLSLNTLVNTVPATYTNVAHYAIGTNPGQVNTDMTEDELATALTARNTARANAVTAAAAEDVEAMKSAYEALADADIIPAPNALPQAGKFYRLRGGNSGKYVIGGTKTDAGVARVVMENLSEAEEDAYKFVYYLDSSNKLLSYMTGYFINNTCEQGAAGVGSTWTIARSAYLGALTLTSNYTGSNKLYDNGAHATANRQCIDRNGSLAGYFTNWTFEEVTALPVSISAAGYATLIAPVALEVPAGVTAYTANFTEEDGKAKLTAIEGSVIPANTGVLLEGAEGAYSFNITTTENEATSDLTGQPQTVNVDAAATAYVLGNKDGKVGFYRLADDDRTVKGTRAYYVAPEGAAAQAFALDFGQTTGIGSVTTPANANAPIYDLSGRRVVKAQKGIYIQNGRKIYVK